MRFITRKNGLIVCMAGIVIFLLNIVTYGLWEIDIDILGLMVFILGLVIAIPSGPSMKNSSGWLTRKGGVKICVIAIAASALLAYSPIPYLNGDLGGILGMTALIIGILIMAIRWRH
ncbi:hypothetical protein JW711_02420 [Candidatus Woesearchaeota archaeon]|nr:hypothetical protein [Candidatus Woesearchaeota archaeon]